MSAKEHQRHWQMSYLCTVFETHREYWRRLGIEKGPFSALGLHNTCSVKNETAYGHPRNGVSKATRRRIKDSQTA